MFKFARYFFFVFLITTVIPLVLMFLWTHHQMEYMGKEREQHLLEVGVKELKNLTNQYLKIQESDILKELQNLPLEKLSLKQLQDIFKTEKIELIKNYRINKITSYYELIKANYSGKPKLYSISILPLEKSEINGIKIIKKVNLAQLRPAGPFDIEIYLGNQINKSSFLGIVQDPFLPPPPHSHLYPPPPHPIKPFNNKIHETVKITDNNGKTIVTLLIKTGGPPGRPFDPKNPVENIFGLVILLAGSTLSLFVGFYINKSFIKPLLILSNALKQIQKGVLSFELDTNTKHEQILNTFNNFNQMVKGLKEKEELRKCFITNLTHDLRTPLIAQERSLGLISKEFENLGLKDAYELAKGTEKNNKHLLRMVNLILESYCFDSENLNFIISDINISEVIDNCFEKLKSLADEKNIMLLNNVPGDFPLIKGDLTSFKRIFLNLISNAIENTNQNGKIKINTEFYENFIKIFVEDNGSGIAQEDLNYIFDRYYTGKSDERKIGSGLGLYVCKKLIEMHNGKISVKSEINNYTKFIINLPLDFQKYEDKL
ncbi:MAG: HAMP domain-containing sensor histidine kinase [bacterium]